MQLSPPVPDLDLTLEQYARLLLALLDIPVHPGALKESLHFLFTLYSEFKSNPHFKPVPVPPSAAAAAATSSSSPGPAALAAAGGMSASPPASAKGARSAARVKG